MTLRAKEAEALRRELDMIKFYRQHPILAAKDLLRVELPVPQQRILTDMWFKTFILVTAGRGSGKCVTGDTLIYTNKGVLPIDSLGSKLDPLSDLNLTVHGVNGQEQTSKWYYDGVRETNDITTSRGYQIRATDEHKLVSWNSSAELEWKKSSEIKVGDKVVIARGANLWSDTDNCTQDEATLMGLAVGDGCFRGNKNLLGFTNGDPEVRNIYSTLGKNVFGAAPSPVKSKDRCPGLNYYHGKVWEKLSSLGVENNTLAGGKKVPSSVMASSKEVVACFLRGLFEADGGVEGNATVSHCTKSVRLAEQVQSLLLNFGIISHRRIKMVKYKGERRPFQIIEINSNNVDIYYKEIGFLSTRKKKSLEAAQGKVRNPNLDTVPFLEETFFHMWNNTRGILTCEQRDLYKKYKNGYYCPTYASLLKCIKLYPFSDEHKDKLIKIVEDNYYFDEVKSVGRGLNEVYDLVVPETHSFVGNGFMNHNTFLTSVFACLWALLYPGQKIGLLAPSFRQARMMFAEVEKRWNEAPLLQEATTRKPITASDKCYLQFRQSGFKAGSVIEAIPLGTGEKIRGARYYVILADEFAQIPEVIYNTVILPMGATVANPMENVKRIERERALIASGAATQDDFTRKMDNKVIMTSSAFFQFNHMYTTKQMYEKNVEDGQEQYAVHSLSFREMPEGFLSEENLKQARLKLSSIQFRMEYEAIWEADSAGVFKASLISKCQSAATHSVQLTGNSGAEYVLGVDPARASDAFAICLIELGAVNKVVGAWEYYKNVFPKMAKTIMDLCSDFNVIAVHMDAGAGGGGLAMKDLLFEEERWGAALRLVDPNDEENKHVAGRHILHMFQPSPKSNAEAVFSSLNLMEQGMLHFPLRPQPHGTDKSDFANLDEAEKVYDTVVEMTRQLMLIEVSESRSGVAHFDVPSGGGHATQKKDLFTAYILAAKKAYDLMLGNEEDSGILEVGIVANRDDYIIPTKNKLADSLVVSQVPMNSWAFKTKFKPGL